MSTGEEDAPRAVRMTGLVLGPIAAFTALAIAHPSMGAKFGLTAAAAYTLALLCLMCVWWVTTAVDMAVTALLPVVLLPLMGVGSVKECAAPYADDIIFLFAGGAAIGLALERNHVSARFAAAVVGLAGTSPVAIIIAIFAATAFLSAWVSNTATAAMMLPVALAVSRWAERCAQTTPRKDVALRNFAIVTLLSVAYGASIGGLLTIIGSPPNAIAADWLENNGVPMDFGRWMQFSAPVVLVFSPLAIGALLLMNPIRGLVLAPNAADPSAALDRPPLTAASWVTIVIFVVTAAAWIAVPRLGLPKGVIEDGSIAVAAAVLLFTITVGTKGVRVRPLEPSALRELPWGVLILFGGGLSLAAGMQRSGLSTAIGQSFVHLGDLPAPLIVGAIVATLVFASEIASNTALTATAVPILGALAPALRLPPEALVIPAAYGASYAFMLPVGTPPNALVYATKRVPIGRMLRSGFVLNIVGAFVITALACMLLVPSGRE